MTKQHVVPHDRRGLSDELLVDIVEIFKAISDPTRAQLVYLLTEHEYSVNELSEYVTVSASAVSHHLAKLRAIRLVKTRREGNQIFYSVDDTHIAHLFKEALYHLDHVRQNLPDHQEALQAE
jgi:DNA-binding transcriptional ArsR family regulator